MTLSHYHVERRGNYSNVSRRATRTSARRRRATGCTAANDAVSAATSTLARGCTRIAGAALVALVIFGDNTSARSSPGHEARFGQKTLHANDAPMAFACTRASVRCHRDSRVRPRSTSMASSSTMEKRHANVVQSIASWGSGGAGGGTPAYAYSVSRFEESQQRRRVQTQTEGSRSSIMQSPRYAAASGGRSYPERLQVTTAPSLDSSTPGDEFDLDAKDKAIGRPALPVLSHEDVAQLKAGQRVQMQTRKGGAGTGSVVVDVRADADVVLDLLTNYDDYAGMIDTVRQCTVFPGKGDTRKVEVTVSRFRLHIRVLMSYLRNRNMVQFKLDPDCTKAGRAVLREATGFFFVESLPERPGFSRVWMSAKVDVNRFVPGGIVDYAAARALPRASTWIKPTCEAAQRRKIREMSAARAPEV